MEAKNIFLLLGSNLGDRLFNLISATDSIERQAGVVLAKSRVYETAAWGKSNQPNFFNQALLLETSLAPNELLAKIQSIEKAIGRTPSEKWGERLIDIDIIYFGNEIVHSPNLVVPHPLMAERKFVLVPLAEISPEFIHPVLLKSNSDLLNECKDTLGVFPFP